MTVDQLRAEVGSVRLDNPVMLASGVQGSSLARVLEALRLGAGGAVTKSVGLTPREGYPDPTIVPCDSGFVNAVGLPNPGVQLFSEELARIDGMALPVFVSVYGSGPAEFEESVRILDRNDFAAYELNLSCPHVEKVGVEVGSDPDLVSLITRAARSQTKKPIFVKLSPNAEKLVEIATAAADAGANGVTAINTARALVIDVKTGKPSLSHRYGGLSGGALRPIALRCVYELSENLDIPIIGCGGISTWEHAVQFLLAGADAVQVGTATLEKFALFNEINLGIISYLESKGYRGLRDMVGGAHTDGANSKTAVAGVSK